MLIRLEDICRNSAHACRGVAMVRSARAVPVEFMTEDELYNLPEDVLDEALKDWLAKAKASTSRAVKSVAKRIAQALGRKKKAAPPKPIPKIQPRERTKVRPKGKPGGIPPAPPKDTLEPIKEPPQSPTQPPTKPRKPQYTWDELQKLRKKGEKDQAEWPANWDTTAPGAPVSMPGKKEPPEAVKRRTGPRGGKAQYRPAVSNSEMYKHVVRAIYVTGKANGYAFREGPARSSQKIARGKMIKWGYAKRASKAGGVPDRRRIELTGKGQQRSFRRHANEPVAVKRAKDLDYQAIVSQDPL